MSLYKRRAGEKKEVRGPLRSQEVLPNRRQVRSRLRKAIQELFRNDADLFARDVAERAIAGRLAIYLATEFPRLHVDVEYNRHGFDRKRLNLPDGCGGHRRLVYPDIVVHRRGDDDSNLLAVELKKSNNPEPRDCDRAKLAAMKTQLGYRNCVLVEFPVGLDRIERTALEEWA